jgi:hypothetical protein
MEELLTKYNSLDLVLQRQVDMFVDYLLSTKRAVKQTNISNYKEKILNVSQWTDEDMQVFEDSNKLFDKWNIQEW